MKYLFILLVFLFVFFQYAYLQPCGENTEILNFTCSDTASGSIEETDPDQIGGIYSCGLPDAPLPGAGPDKVYAFTPQVSGDVTLTLSNLNCDLNLYVLSPTCNNNAGCLEGSTNEDILDEIVTFFADMDFVYYIIIEFQDPFPVWPCSYTLEVTSIGLGGCPEHCSNGIDDDIDGDIDCVDNDCGPDTDSDGICNSADLDDDNDGVPDGIDLDPLNPFVCQDLDEDGCDDCSVGVDGFGPQADNDPANDGVDTDGDGQCDFGDPDIDNDGVGNADDINFLNPYICQDIDGDGCDDCSIGVDGFGPQADNDPANDGVDIDGDGLCDSGDVDIDNDGILNEDDMDPADPGICQDLDEDGCDDCSVGVDGFGTQADNDPANDGEDTDGDGQCDSGDPDIDNDGVENAADMNNLDPFICQDLDEDGCDDCSVGVDGFGPQADHDPFNDGPDADGDGICNSGEEDSDNDGVADGSDTDPFNPFVCQDLDGDGCDDCNVGVDGFGPLDDYDPSNDGVDTDGDGLCDTGDPDDDNDGVPDTLDPNPVDPGICGDSDEDGCDDCSVGVDGFGPLADNLPFEDGPDTDSDGICDASDNCPDLMNPNQSDLDNDGIGDLCDPDYLTSVNIGIGTVSPRAGFHIANGSVFIDNDFGGFMMRSTDGNCWMVKIQNTGEMTTMQVDCPQ